MMGKVKKDILFLCQFFYPEYNSSATLPFDTAKYLAECGYSVDAMCGYPKEYSTETDIPTRETTDNVNIHRLRYLQLSRGGKLGRLINYFSFTLSALLHLFEISRYKCVIVYSNPPILPIVPILANIIWGVRFVFVAYDIYPEVAYASDSLKQGGAIDKAMRLINRQLYSRAAMVVALTEEMQQFILQNRPDIDESRVCVIPNWAHEGKQAAGAETFERFGYQEDQFIVSYFGNMGVCQDIETILEAIRLLKDNVKIQFLIAGHGIKKARVESETKGFSNVKILDFLTGEAFEQALAISSCGIVSLEKGLIGTCAPSKYYSYLQCGIPVLSIAEKESYLVNEADKENIGFGVRSGDGEDLAKVITELSINEGKLFSMSRNARLLYEKKYAKHNAMKEYKEIILRVLLECLK